jgi:hypothetical protein
MGNPPYFVKHSDPRHPDIVAGRKLAFTGAFVTLGQAQAAMGNMLRGDKTFDAEIVSLIQKRQLEREMIVDEDITYADSYLAQVVAEGDCPDPSLYSYTELKALSITQEQAKTMLLLEEADKNRYQIKLYLKKLAKGAK